MNEDQKERILDMRARGTSYGRIAEVMNLSRGAVSGVCRVAQKAGDQRAVPGITAAGKAAMQRAYNARTIRANGRIMLRQTRTPLTNSDIDEWLA